MTRNTLNTKQSIIIDDPKFMTCNGIMCFKYGKDQRANQISLKKDGETILFWIPLICVMVLYFQILLEICYGKLIGD